MERAWRYLTQRKTANGSLWLGLAGAGLIGAGHSWGGVGLIAAAWLFDVTTKESQ